MGIIRAFKIASLTFSLEVVPPDVPESTTSVWGMTWSLAVGVSGTLFGVGAQDLPSGDRYSRSPPPSGGLRINVTR